MSPAKGWRSLSTSPEVEANRERSRQWHVIQKLQRELHPTRPKPVEHRPRDVRERVYVPPVGTVAGQFFTSIPVPRDSRSMSTREFLRAAAVQRRGFSPRASILLLGYLDSLEECARANDCALCLAALTERETGGAS
jgi:hypothetical protein